MKQIKNYEELKKDYVDLLTEGNNKYNRNSYQFLFLKETEKAINIKIVNYSTYGFTGEKTKYCWIPKSQIIGYEPAGKTIATLYVKDWIVNKI